MLQANFKNGLKSTMPYCDGNVMNLSGLDSLINQEEDSVTLQNLHVAFNATSFSENRSIKRAYGLEINFKHITLSPSRITPKYRSSFAFPRVCTIMSGQDRIITVRIYFI